MLQSFQIVGTQVLILFILIALGFLAGKIKIFGQEGIKSINNLMLYIVSPCVIVNAFQREFDILMLRNLLLSMLAGLISHALCYLFGFLLIKNKDTSKQSILRFAGVFSNCGFMALPLADALLGSEGVFYASGYLAVFNLVVWTVGQYQMGKGQPNFAVRNAFINPNVIAVVIGLLFFFTSFKLPELIAVPVEYLAALNTPVPMLIIGYTISTQKLGQIVRIKEEIVPILIRLVIGPLSLLGIMYLLGVRGALLTAVTISASSPVAAITAMFAIKFNKDEKLGSKMVMVSTVFSLITMTLIVGFANYISG